MTKQQIQCQNCIWAAKYAVATQGANHHELKLDLFCQHHMEVHLKKYKSEWTTVKRILPQEYYND